MKYVLIGFLSCAISITIGIPVFNSSVIADRCDEASCAISPISLTTLGAYDQNARRWRATAQEHRLLGSTLLGAVEGNGAVDKKHKNGKRDTLIYVPHHLDRSKKVTMLLWFHGLNGFKLDSVRIPTSIKNLDRLGKNYILVAPEMPWSRNTSTKRKRQSYAWNTKRSKHENLPLFYNNVLQLIKDEYDVVPNEVYILGHSAGGSAVKNAANLGSLNVINPQKIIFSDAGYGSWTGQTWRSYLAKNTNCKFILLVRKGDRPYLNTLRFLKGFAKVPSNIVLKIFPRDTWTHRRIGDNSMYMNIVWQ